MVYDDDGLTKILLFFNWVLFRVFSVPCWRFLFGYKEEARGVERGSLTCRDTPLVLAARRGRREMVELLLAAGAHVEGALHSGGSSYFYKRVRSLLLPISIVWLNFWFGLMAWAGCWVLVGGLQIL